jgi:hypothetical protein
MRAPSSSGGARAPCWWTPQGWSCGSRSTALLSRTERLAPWCWRESKRRVPGWSRSGATRATPAVDRLGLQRNGSGMWKWSGIPRSRAASGHRSGRSWIGRRSDPRCRLRSNRQGSRQGLHGPAYGCQPPAHDRRPVGGRHCEAVPVKFMGASESSGASL